jgi:hypothetical protein
VDSETVNNQAVSPAATGDYQDVMRSLKMLKMAQSQGLITEDEYQ